MKDIVHLDLPPGEIHASNRCRCTLAILRKAHFTPRIHSIGCYPELSLTRFEISFQIDCDVPGDASESYGVTLDSVTETDVEEDAAEAVPCARVQSQSRVCLVLQRN
jgi:hypothetical protein